MKYSVCIDCVTMGMNTLEAMRLAKASGYNAVEFWAWENKNLSEMKKLAEELELEVAAFCMTANNMGDPKNEAAVLEGVKNTIEAMKLLNTKVMLVTVGQCIPRISHAEHHDSAVAILKKAAVLAEEAGVTMVVEPLNPIDHPGYHMPYAEEAFRMVDEVGSPNVKVLYDIYHQQITEGDVLRAMLKNVDKLGHIHMAQNPGRVELGLGELNYPYMIRKLTEAGYDGYFGLEYLTGDPKGSLERDMKLLPC